MAALALSLLGIGSGIAWCAHRVATRPDRSAIDEAFRRIAEGEKGVRIESVGWGRWARAARIFNAAAEAWETRTSSAQEIGSTADRSMFGALRANRASARPWPRDRVRRLYVAVVEVDRFAALRQSIGYHLASRLLETLSARITECVDGAETGRIGRTTIEFAFPATSAARAESLLAQVADALERRITIDDCHFDLSVAVGYADAGESSIADEHVDQAAAALTVAQRDRVKVRFADAAAQAQRRFAGLEMMRDLPAALTSGEIDLHYQPKLAARTNLVPAVEGFLRWNSVERGPVPTDRLIAVAEETGAIRDVTVWMIKRALRDQAALARAGHDILVHVDISGLLLPDRIFARHVLDLIGDARGRIGFEITETAVIADPDAALENLNAFAAAGIRIAIDGYGSGLSSLACLKQVPADELKFDRMFVTGLTQSPRNPLLVRSSIDLAHAFGMEVTAEGVDDPMSLSLLRVMGCDLLQGNIVSHPLPLAGLIAFLGDTDGLDALAGPPSSSENRQAAMACG